MVLPLPLGALEKANMLLMTKEATDKGRSFKTQMLLSTAENSNSLSEKTSGEPVCKKPGYFSYEKADFNIEKRDFRENALCYINHGVVVVYKDIRPVLNFLFFFYDKISQAPKSTKRDKKELKSTKRHN